MTRRAFPTFQLVPSPRRPRGIPAALTLGVLLAAGCGGNGDTAGNNGATTPSRPLYPTSTTDQAKAHVVSAQQAVKSGDRERALAEFAKAIEINPNLTTAHMGVGDIYRMEGKYSEAEPSFARAATIEPNNFDAQYMHGLMLQLLDRVSDAINAYSRALRIRPNDFKANLNMSAAYYSLDENAQALVYGKRAVELKPTDGPARFNLGAVYAAMDRPREAVKEFQQAAELMELSPSLLMNLSDSLGKLQRYDEMRNTLETLVQAQPTAAAYERLGFALFGLRKYDEALVAFEKSLEKDPDYVPALNGQGVILMNRWLLSDQKDIAARDKAITSWRRSLQLTPNQQKILELLTRYGGK